MSEGDDDVSVSMGEEGIVSGGVFDHGTQEGDGQEPGRPSLLLERYR